MKLTITFYLYIIIFYKLSLRNIYIIIGIIYIFYFNYRVNILCTFIDFCVYIFMYHIYALLFNIGLIVDFIYN